MAALSSAFNPSVVPKSSAPKQNSVQGSQRAAAVAALSSVLTAEMISAESAPQFSRDSSLGMAISGISKF